MNRFSIDEERGASRTVHGIGCRWLVACGLMVGAGCAAQPLARMDPPDSLKARPGASAGAAEAARAATRAAPREAGRHTLEAVAPDAIVRQRSELAALREGDDLEVQLERLKADVSMVEDFAGAGTAEVFLSPEAWRRPGFYGDPSEWQSALAGATQAPPDKLDQVRAIEDDSEAALWRASTLAFQSRQRLDDVFDGDATMAAELARARAAGSQVAADRLEESWERLSATQLAHGPVTFGFKGSPDSAMPAAGPGLTAHLGAADRFPGKVDVGLSMDQGAPAFAPLSGAFGTAQSLADEHLHTFGPHSEPLASALEPGATATAQQPAAGRMRARVAHQYGAAKWWLSAGSLQDVWSGAGATGAPAPEQTADVDGGLQYDLGSDVAVVAAYRFADDRAEFAGKSFRSSAGADEQLHVGSLRLVWRFAPPAEARSAEPVTGERFVSQSSARQGGW
jgi:hypothetical protein